MKRYILGGLAALVLFFGGAPIVSADVNNFVISSFEADYYIGRDSDGRSTLRTVEKITAKFPDYDQNHGLERAIPQSYDGHTTSLKIESVTDAMGRPFNYSSSTSNDNLVLRIGDSDRYVHGVQTYVITYTQRDVTRYFADVDRDEWYWDTNGTQWRVPTVAYTANIHVDSSLKSAITTNQACYKGVEGSADVCEINEVDGVLQIKAVGLSQQENVTVALGFQPGTFTAYKPSLWQIAVMIWTALTLVCGVVVFGLMLWFIVRWYRVSNRSRELGTIVPEYIPPKDTSVTASANVMPSKGSAFAAQLIDLAVRHYIKIYETKEKSFWRPTAEYDIEIVRDPSTLLDEEIELLRDMFGGNELTVGSRLSLKSLRNNSTYRTLTIDNDTKLRKLMRAKYGLRARDEQAKRWFVRAGWVVFVFAVLLLSLPLVVAAIASFILGYTLWPFTDKGLALNRYLRGLKMYIEVAEVDRLRMLQSPEGAEKTGVTLGSGDTVQLVKLYERVLPYAILFGQEKAWTKQLGEYYQTGGAQPDWYVGQSAFNAAMFSSAMSSFSTATQYTSSSSSSSGGSSGGGSSGGGGGGGGGGGW